MEHVSKLTSSCFFQLRRLCEVRKYVNLQVLKQLVHAFIITRLDYCNCILACLLKYLILQLQRVQNAAARLIFGLRPRDHVTSVIQQLHWLPVYCLIQYKLRLLMYSAYHQHCPTVNYLQYLATGSTLMAVGPSQSPAPQSGTLSRILSGTPPSVQTVSDVC